MPAGTTEKKNPIVLVLLIVVAYNKNYPFSKYSNIQLDSEALRTKTIETRWNECEKYLHIIHFPLSLSSKPLFQAEF